ncbi:threonine--tRNA ligase [Neofamilia massiliensis]|uniref:threonine--tRNA ligase n=1 Tax=Neofamilia massiliensis TaxID=1673724 RepID=UPI000A9F7D45|nr:threonine--tRNA ligase [Neofamilia massiliensis]
MIKLILPDGSERQYDSEVLAKEAVQDISMGLYREALGVVVNGKILGMNDTIKEGGDFKVVKFADKEGKAIFWHTSSHVLAAALQRLYPQTKFAIGPAIADGFYYDIDLDEKLTEDDLEKIEKEAMKIARENLDVEKIVISREEALERFPKDKDPYKYELISDLPEGEEISLYKLGDFVDLCRGPHLESTKKIKAIKLLSIAGAYWRGDSKNKMLQRIYGISFEKQKNLDEYLEMRAEAEKRDHRKLGKELDLFSFHEEGPGFPFYHPNGMVLRNTLLDWWRQVLLDNGYGEILTPIILNEGLWHQSGHWDHYKENMYFTKIDENDYAVKPMNCPGSVIVYGSTPHSYRDLPIRLAEYGLVHRHELSGALHGLFRVRAFTQDDAHVYCLRSQIKDEVFRMIDLADYLYGTFGFKYSVEVSTRPDDYMGDLESWNLAEDSLKKALEEKGIPYEINEGDGAFYGPKIDFQLEDAIGRTWQCGTIQLDFQLPENFDLTYINEKGEKERPVMLHRALLGSFERFLGILIEHFAGKFPLWLAPVQLRVIPVSEKFLPYAEEVEKTFKDAGFRIDLDRRDEKLGKKIRDGQLQKIPYVFVVGEKEVEGKNISVRARDGIDLGVQEIDEFLEKIKKEVEEKQR